MNPTEEPSEYQSYYAIVRQIPAASVLTYGDVAALAGRPRSARRVGYALSALKDPSVPWWRVVASGGVLSRGDTAAGRRHAAQLRRDGVAVRGGRVVDFAQRRFVPAN